MTQHMLDNRSEKELLWYQRRSFLSAAAAWTAMGGFPAALAQQRSNIVEFVGDAQLNGARLLPQQSIQTGDEIVTGPGTTLIFVVGNASFKVRQNSRMSVERVYPRSGSASRSVASGPCPRRWRPRPRPGATRRRCSACLRVRPTCASFAGP